MEIAGILFGLGAAAAQSLSYVFSRLLVIRRQEAVLRLLILGHVLMGLISLAILPMLSLGKLPPWRTFALQLGGACAFYLLGQLGMFQLLRHAEASRASPLLGLKILMLGIIYTIVPGTLVAAYTGTGTTSPLGLSQWLAIGMAVAAAIMLRTSGPRLSAVAVGWLLFACLSYCISDMSIKGLVSALRPLGAAQANVTAVCLSYLLCGVLAAAMLPLSPKGHAGDWGWSLPWAISWLGAMLLLYACFDAIGVVHGNIVQSTRGLISIAMGSAIARWGHEHIEAKVPRRVLLRRLAAGVIMFVAIVVFSL